jgi:hypothetical protein
MMLGAMSCCFVARPSLAAAPEALEPDFLDYLLACESKDDNWTVVADAKLRKKINKAPPVKEKSEAPANDAQQEAKP